MAPYLIGVRYYLDDVARAALEQLRPALTVDEGAIARLRYMLTTLPRRTTRIVSAVAVVFFVANWINAPAWLMEQYTSTPTQGLVLMGPLGLFTFLVGALSVAEAVHQLDAEWEDDLKSLI